MISCLMVTQASRLSFAALSIGDFAQQTHVERELIVLHDGGDDTTAALQLLARTHAGAPIRVVSAPPGESLGALRNRAVGLAAGDWICQWDDDDRCHPERLALQWDALRAADAEFSFLVDQLHWFPSSRELFWDDWDGQAYPLNLIEGTLLGRRSLMPQYPHIARGEDTGAVRELLRRGHPVARLRNAGWCYVYVYHGSNAWPAHHHRAISATRHFGAARLIRHEATLRRRLSEYRPALGPLTLPHEAGVMRLPD
jgi:glycosyltransferase involved in cell wall biosynthesis